jgi:guanylate kinase
VRAVLLILTGPSCVGKDPLLAALRRCHPELGFVCPVLHASRRPRPGESDGVEFWFRPAREIAAYDPQRVWVYRLREQYRAVDLDELERQVGEHERVVVQITPPAVGPFRDQPRVQALRTPVLAVMLQPADPREVACAAAAAGRSPVAELADRMVPKLVRRAQRLGQNLSVTVLEDILVRARAAWAETTETDRCEHVWVNPCAEGDDAWQTTPPTGHAGELVVRCAALLAGPTPIC